MKENCKLCQKKKILQQSHAIPDSIFKKLFKLGSGKAIHLNENDCDIEYTSDSLDTPQLCSDCERHINIHYETYSIGLLRNNWKAAQITPNGVTFKEVDTEKFCMFLISIFWRAANSSHPNYSGAVMPAEFFYENTNDIIRQSILHCTPIPRKTVSIKIQRLIDRSNEMSIGDLKNLIITPFFRKYKNAPSLSVCFAFEGFLITLIMPGLKFSARKHENLIDKNSKIIFAEYLDLFSDYTIKNLLLATYEKAITGKSKLKKEQGLILNCSTSNE